MSTGLCRMAAVCLFSSAVLLLSGCGSVPRAASRPPAIVPPREPEAPRQVERHVSTSPKASLEWSRWAATHRPPPQSRLAAETGAGVDVSNMIWHELGPRNVAGRVISLAFRDPAHPRSILAGSAGGGIWASEDFGATWRQLDGDNLASLWIGAIAVDPTNPKRIYAGTGEGNTSRQGTGGAEAILKSDDGGEHFRAISVHDAGAFFKIVVSWADPAVVVAAANDGIHRSGDRGESWSKTGPCPATDLLQDPDRAERFIAACSQIFGGGGGLVESTDAGLSWHSLGSGLPPEQEWGRAAIALADKPARTLFLWIGTKPGPSGHTQLYRSLDDGATWLLVEGATTGSYQSWYGNHLKVLGTAEGQRLLYADGYQILAGESPGTIDASTAWVRAGGKWHVDTHGVEFSPSDPNLWIVATDGGVATSSDGGRSFFRADQGFPTVQYYACALRPGDSVTIFGGSQDNGLHVYRGDPGGAFDLGELASVGGDVTAISVNPSNPDDVVAFVVRGDVIRSADGGRTWVDLLPLAFQNDIAVWSAVRSPTEPLRLFAGGLQLRVSPDGGTTWQSSIIRPGNVFFSIISLAVSPADGNVMWALWDDGTLMRSGDGGTTWAQQPLPPNGDGVKVAAGPDAGSAYVILRADRSVVLRTRDGGATWADISADLPPILAETILADPQASGRLFVGLETGAALSPDDGEHWYAFDAGLPRAVVQDFCLDPTRGDLVAATYGRGLWKLEPPIPCTTNAATLCLLNGRFSVSVEWRNQHSPGEQGVGAAVADTDQTGRFSFFSPDSIELIVKMIDGGAVNQHFWFFYGALSDVEYTITVRDTQTGVSRTYYNAPGNICGGADTSAFEDGGRNFGAATLAPAISAGPISYAESSGSCSPTSSDLCLLGGRFKVSVAWKDQHSGGRSGSGTAVPSSDQTGYFWFFSSDSFELAVKIIDGRDVNGHFWVFSGALSDVEYTITVTDTQTGAVRTLHNEPGNVCGTADTSAFADAG